MSTGPVELEADERPGAAGDVGEAVGGGGHPDDRRGGVVRADGGRPAVPSVGRCPGRCPGGSIGGQQVGGDAEPVEQVGRTTRRCGRRASPVVEALVPRCAARR